MTTARSTSTDFADRALARIASPAATAALGAAVSAVIAAGRPLDQWVVVVPVPGSSLAAACVAAGEAAPAFECDGMTYVPYALPEATLRARASWDDGTTTAFARIRAMGTGLSPALPLVVEVDPSCLVALPAMPYSDRARGVA